VRSTGYATAWAHEPSVDETRARPLLLAQLVHAGPLDDGVRAIAPLCTLAKPVADYVRVMPFSAMFPAEEQGTAHGVSRASRMGRGANARMLAP
jgi:hypothetical protein